MNYSNSKNHDLSNLKETTNLNIPEEAVLAIQKMQEFCIKEPYKKSCFDLQVSAKVGEENSNLSDALNHGIAFKIIAENIYIFYTKERFEDAGFYKLKGFNFDEMFPAIINFYLDPFDCLPED